jgi:hypothetical protein
VREQVGERVYFQILERRHAGCPRAARRTHLCP